MKTAICVFRRICNENEFEKHLKFMKNFLFLLILPLCFYVSIKAQDAEKDSVKRVVETYLFSENDDERKQTLFEKTKIYATNADDSKIEETPISAKAKKVKGARVVSVQKIVNIDIFENAASVKVETDLSSKENKVPKHFQYISLLKVGGTWKIVSVLMPKIRLAQ